jgi:hypothetical protein
MQIIKILIKSSLNIGIYLVILSLTTLSIFSANIAESFEPEYDEKGFIINDPRYPTLSTGDDTPINNSGIDEEELNNIRNSLNEKPFQLEANNIKSGELASCFDYNKSDNIKIDLKSNTDSFAPGDAVIIEGAINNNSNSAIVNATVYGRLVRNLDNPIFNRASTITLDEFIIASDINLDAGASYVVDSIYQLPINAIAGEYELLLYVYNNNKFNLSGLTFSESVYGGRIPFTVSGENKNYIYLDKTAIKVNGQPYDTVNSLEQYDKGEIKVETTLVNDTQESRRMKVTYKLYRWDSTFESNFIQNLEEVYTVEPEQKLPISYTIDNATEPVYALKIISLPEEEIQVESYKSIANIRFGINSNLRPRLHFVGLDTYPITKQTNIITCIHNTSSEIDEGPVKVVTTLKNSRNRELGRIEYSGPISARVEGLISKLSSFNLTGIVTLESILYDSQGTEIDKVSIDYDCNKINTELCSQIENNFINTNTIVLIVVILILLIAITIKLKWSHIKHYIIKNK